MEPDHGRDVDAWRARIDQSLRRDRRRQRGRTMGVVLAGMVLAVVAVRVADGESSPIDAGDGVTATTFPAVETVASTSGTTAPPPVPSTTTSVVTQVTSAAMPAPAAPVAAVAPAPGECAAAGDAWLDIGVGPPLRQLNFGDAKLVLAPELDLRDESEEVVGAVASTPDLATIAVVLDATGGEVQAAERILVAAGGELDWTPVSAATEIEDPAVSPFGTRLAWVADGELTIAAAAGGWTPAPLPVPVSGGRASFLRFIDEDRLLLAVEEPATGATLESAARSEVWLHEVPNGGWTRLTFDTADFGHWSHARSPIGAGDGSVLYVRHRGTSAAGGDARSELRRVTGVGTPDLSESVVTEVASHGLLVAAAADGSTLWNVADGEGRAQLVVRDTGGTTWPVGCGRHQRAALPRELPLPRGVVLTPEVDGPDPFVVIEGGQPWVFTTNTVNGHVPVATLAAGEGTVVTDALPDLPPWASPGFTWAPAVGRTAGGWTLWFTARHEATGRQCIGAARAAAVQGPYESEPEPLVCDVERGGSIDPSPVVQGDGRLVLLYKSDGNCCGLPTTIDAVELDGEGTAVVSDPVELLGADRSWEGGIVEGPTMIHGPDGTWWLLYSAHRWASANYAVGAARCASPLGPCAKQPVPVLDEDGHPGAGGAEFVAQTSLVLLHAWTPDSIGYEAGGHRRVLLGRVEDRCGLLSVRILPAAGELDHPCE